MTIKQFLIILNARKLLFLVTLLLTVSAATAAILLWPKSYKATTTIVLNYKGIDPLTGMTMPAQLMPGYIATQVDIIRSRGVAVNVVDQLRLVDIEDVRNAFLEDTEGKGDIREWVADLLLKRLSIAPARESSVLSISFKGADPQFSASIANAFASEYQKTAIHLKGEPLQRASSYFNDQIKVLRTNLEMAQNRQSTYQQEKGIVSVDNRLDVESTRLNELSTQLVLVQGQLTEAASRQKQIERGGAADSPDILANPLIQNLKASLAQAEAKLSHIGERLGKNHPDFNGAKAEVDKLRTEVNSNIRSTSSSIAANLRILKQREAEVAGALLNQRTKLLELNRARDELAVLTKEVESAQRAYDTTIQRYSQTSIEGQANQTDVSILSTAVAPTRPTNPHPLLIIAAAVVVGLLYAAGLCIWAEMRDRRIRSADDVVEHLGLKLIGVLRPKKSATSKKQNLTSSQPLPSGI